MRCPKNYNFRSKKGGCKAENGEHFFTCTLPEGHKGDHHAHTEEFNTSANCICRWPQKEAFTLTTSEKNKGGGIHE